MSSVKLFSEKLNNLEKTYERIDDLDKRLSDCETKINEISTQVQEILTKHAEAIKDLMSKLSINRNDNLIQ